MDDKKYTGFSSYLVEKKITPEFIKDFEYWMKRYFRQWSLFTDWEDFKGICWEALMEKLPSFDPKVATIQTFCISRINNECWRIYMHNKGIRPENDIDEPSVNCDIEAQPSIDLTYFNRFSEYCHSLGVKVDIENLFSDYNDGSETDGVKTFSWWMMKEKLKHEHTGR